MGLCNAVCKQLSTFIGHAYRRRLGWKHNKILCLCLRLEFENLIYLIVSYVVVSDFHQPLNLNDWPSAQRANARTPYTCGGEKHSV